MVYFFSITAAVLFSLAAFIQHKEAQLTPKSTNLKIALISQLIKRPLWILGVGLDVLAFLAQFMALKAGSLLLVQPILAFGLTSTLLLEAIWGAKKSSPRVVVLSLVSAGVLAVFLLTTSVPVSESSPGLVTGAILTVVAVSGFILLRVLAPRLGVRAYGMVLGASVGALHGLATFVTKAAANQVATHGLFSALHSWPLYSLIVIGSIDLVLTQSAFQSAPLYVTMPLINVIEPSVAMLMGYLVLSESITGRFGYGFLGVILATMAIVTVVISISAARLVESSESA